VLDPYRQVLSVPGAAAFVTAGAFARLPISMLGIGIVFLVQASTGSYGLAGAVAAIFGLVQSLAAPVVARAVDRFGQATVMRPAVLVHVVGIALLVLSAQLRAPLWTSFAAAILMGATIGSMGALVRARWSHVLTGRVDRAARLHTAYSLESVLDEAVFIAGPLLITILATQVSPVAGLLTAALAVAVGGMALLAQRGTEPPATGHRAAGGTGVLRSGGMVVVVVVFVAVGAIFGAIEVITIAFTEERGVPGWAGAVLAVFALGSLLAGLAYGLVSWTTSPGRRFVLGVLLLGLAALPLYLVDDVLLLAGVGLLVGFTIAPTIISGNALVQDLVVPSRLTEGLTWVATAISLGAAGGAALSGAAVDAVGPQRAFGVPVLAGLLAAGVAALGWRWVGAGPGVAAQVRAG
jgi:MFS family permease